MDNTIKILHLEDVESDAMLVEAMLNRSAINYKKMVVDNRKDFVDALKKFNPDIVVSDHSLPGFDSLEALKIVKQKGLNIPFILVTANMSEEFAVGVMREGASDYLLKDRMQRLPVAITNAIEKNNLEKEQLHFLKELITNEAFLIEAEKIANIGSMEVELHSQKAKWSPGMYRILGYSSDKVKPSLQKVIDCIHTDDKDAVRREIDLAIESGRSATLDFRLNDNPKKTKYLHAKILIHSDVKGRPAYLKGFAQDVTETALSEKSLMSAQQEKQNAEQLANTKQMFLANMSHEIRTPMNAIIGMSNQLSKTRLDDRQQLYLDTIHSAADNLLSIINDILDLAKIDAGKIQIEHIGFDLKKLVNQTIQVQLFAAEQKGLKLSVSSFDENIWPVFTGDPHRISQVLTNLVSNAIKFTQRGPVDLSLEVLEENGETQVLQVQVKDTGIGMDETYLRHLFDKFSQENESTTRTYGGTGLGMSICKELIELMGGKIYAKSKKGVGTTISFILELAKGEANNLPVKTPVRFSDTFLKGKKILVADDNEMNRLLAEVILQNYGAETIDAENGEQVLTLINQKPDLVLMDIQMPLMNGFDAAKRLREMNIAVPIIALTANVIKGERDKSLASGMNDYIAKPFVEEELLAAIDKWLNATPEELLPPAMEETPPLFDLSKLQAMSRGNDTFVQRMIGIFCDQAPQMVKEMQEAFEIDDFDKVAAIAHKIKPSVENLGMSELSRRIKWVETNAKERTGTQAFATKLAEIDDMVGRAIAAMKKVSLNG